MSPAQTNEFVFLVSYAISFSDVPNDFTKMTPVFGFFFFFFPKEFIFYLFDSSGPPTNKSGLNHEDKGIIPSFVS